MAEKKNGIANPRLIMLVACGALGLLLLLYGGGYFTGDEESVKSYTGDSVALIEYTKALEDSIRQLCSGVSGVSNVSVAVTLENGFEYVYAQNIKSESDGKSYYEISEYLLTEVDGDENVIYITGRAPKISGIGIVYSGLEDEKIRLEIINLISAAFDVKKSRIYVGK